MVREAALYRQKGEQTIREAAVFLTEILSTHRLLILSNKANSSTA